MNFLQLHDRSTAQVEALVARARALCNGEAARRFPDRALGLLFLNPSLRTQASMQRAACKLGLQLVQLQAGGQGIHAIETGDGVVMDGAAAEHLREAAPVLGRYVDLLAVRAFPRGVSVEEDFEDPVIQGFARRAGVPVINLEGALHHPCQALADWQTLDQHGVPRDGTLVLSWCWHPKPLPHAVPNSALCMAAQRGMKVIVQHPPGFGLHEDVVAEAGALAQASGGSIELRTDRSAFAGADAVYAKSWGCLEAWGDPDWEASRRAPFREWMVRASDLEASRPGAPFLHCLPVRRNVVVEDAVLDGPRSVVIDQAENRLHAQTALLESLCEALEDQPQAAGVAAGGIGA